MKHSLILKVVAKFLIPVIVLFALYVQFHGDYGPGGGFQAGVIFSVAFILYAIIFGLETAEQVIPPGCVRCRRECYGRSCFRNICISILFLRLALP